MSRAQTGVLEWRPNKWPIQVRVYWPSGGWHLWSRHYSAKAAQRSLREAHAAYADSRWRVELVDTRKRS